MTYMPRVAVALAVLSAMLSQSISHTAWGQPVGVASGQTKPSKCNRATFRVVLDVGHTAEEPGAISARGDPEYAFNLRLANLIERKLIEAGFRKTLELVTGGPAIPGLVRRAAAANRSKADLLLSIHHDSVPDFLLETWEHEGKQYAFSDRFKGHSIFVSYENGSRAASLLFAKLLGKQLKARGLTYTPHYTDAVMRNRRHVLLDADVGVYRFDKLYVLRAAAMPAVLLEAGSIIHRDEELLMNTEERQSLIAAAALEAVESYCESRSTQRRRK